MGYPVPRSPEPSLQSSNTDPDRISSPDATRARCSRVGRAGQLVGVELATYHVLCTLYLVRLGGTAVES